MRRSRPFADNPAHRTAQQPPLPPRATPPAVSDAVARLRHRQRLIQALFREPPGTHTLEGLSAEADAFNRELEVRYALGHYRGLCRPLPAALLARAQVLARCPTDVGADTDANATDPSPAAEPAAMPGATWVTPLPRGPLPPAVKAVIERFDQLDFWAPLEAAHHDWLDRALAGLDTWVHRGADPAEAWVVALGDQLQLAFTGLLLSGHQTPAQLRQLLDPLNALVDRCNRMRRLPLGQVIASLEPPPRELVARAIALSRARYPAPPRPDAPVEGPPSGLAAPGIEHPPEVPPVQAQAHAQPATDDDRRWADEVAGLTRALHQEDDRLVLQYRNRVQHRLALDGREADEATRELIARATARVSRATGPVPRAPRTAIPPGKH